MSNIRRTEPSSHLFELPEDYEKLFPFSPKEKGMSWTAAENPRVGAYIAGRQDR